MTTSQILGVKFNAMDEAEAIELLMSRLDKPGDFIPDKTARTNFDSCCVIVTPNPEAVMRARREPDFAEALNGADFRFADGTGIVLASKLTRSPIHCRLRGYDTVIKLFSEISKRGRKTTAYFLGGAPGVAETAAKETERQYPALNAVGFHDGFFKPENEPYIIEEIKNLKPDILIISMGMPKQELFAHAHKDLPVKLAFCIGGSIDVMAGSVKLAPAFFRKLGLEWLYRLITQPSRAKRMLALPKFALLILFRFFHPFKRIEEK